MSPPGRPARTRPRPRPAPVLLVTVALTLLYATGCLHRPPGGHWDRVYDVVLYNLPYLAASSACAAAAVRVRSERSAWAALGVALALSALGNVLRVLSAGVDGSGVPSTAAVGVALVGYALLYVPLVMLIRVRVPRFHASMWLDGIIGALGSLAAGSAFLLGPYLVPSAGHAAVALTEMAGPITGLLLLAFLVSVGSILGVRLARTLLLLAVALCCVCVSEITLFPLQVADEYRPGGPLELGWLIGVA